jgi:hypothetical protein
MDVGMVGRSSVGGSLRGCGQCFTREVIELTV